MDKVLELGRLVWEQGPAVLGSLVAIFGGLLAIAVVIPGEQPDKFLGKALELLNKLSRGASKIKISFGDKK